jgi:hypothetical protein
VEIEIRVPGHPPQAAQNITYVLVSAVSYLAREENFSGFQEAMLAMTMNAKPPRPDVATWFLDMEAGHLAHMADMIIEGLKDGQ